MKFKSLILAVAMSSSALAFAQEKEPAAPPAGKAIVGDVYGSPVASKSESSAINTEKLGKKLKKQKKIENVAIKGTVTDVCQKKGCWLTIKTDDNSEFFVKMKDYAFFVPTALKGKNVVMDGSAEMKTISVDEQKHYATDAKKPQTEIDAIKSPKEEIRFVATGIKVIN